MAGDDKGRKNVFYKRNFNIINVRNIAYKGKMKN